MNDIIEKPTPEGVAASAEAILKNAVDELRLLREGAEARTPENFSSERVEWDSILQTVTAIEGMLQVDIMSLKGEKPDLTPEGFRRMLVTLLDDHVQDIVRKLRLVDAYESEIHEGAARLIRRMLQIALKDCERTPDAIIEINKMPLVRAV
jgi:hypothetical protein